MPLLDLPSLSRPWESFWSVAVMPTSYVFLLFIQRESHVVHSSLTSSSYVFQLSSFGTNRVSNLFRFHPPVDDLRLHVCVHSYHFLLMLTRVFSPGIIHGAQQFLPTSLHLTLAYSAIYYPQVLTLKERSITSCFVCLARRCLVASIIANLSCGWEYLLVPISHHLNFWLSTHCHNYTTPRE
jgi:hypothetical protein